MKYDELQIGARTTYGDCKEFLGDEIPFVDLVKEPSTTKLLVLMHCSVDGPEDGDAMYVAQIQKVLDYEPGIDDGDEEWATVVLDNPGFDERPTQLELEDMEPDDIPESEDKDLIINCYTRIWRIKKPLQPLEHLALGAAIYSKCKANYIDSTQDLLDAISSGLVKTIFKGSQVTQIMTVLRNAKIDIPEQAAPDKPKEQPKPQPPAEIVKAAPEEPSDPFTRAKALHRRILADAQAAAESIWDMCTAIKEMRDGKHYRYLLYDNFEGYCENELGMSRSHAYRYIQIAEGMSAENVASMGQIGTTKLALLASCTEEQREIVTAAVDVESATVKDLKAQIDELKGKVSKAEQDAQKAVAQRNAEAARVEETDAALDRAQARIASLEADKKQFEEAGAKIKRLNAEIANNSDYIGKINEQCNSLKSDNAQLQDRVRELESGRDHVLDELRAKITELESRPVEVAVQDDSEALDQLRKEYEAKLKEAEAEIQETIEDARYREINAMVRIARENVNMIVMRIKGLPACKAKDTMIKYTKEIGLLLKQL